jgi:hypothetical protein
VPQRRFLLFKKLLAGHSAVTFPPAHPSMCTPDRWRPLRDSAYNRTSTVHVPAAAQEQPTITFLATKDGERRGLSNVKVCSVPSFASDAHIYLQHCTQHFVAQRLAEIQLLSTKHW